ncbi:shuttle craft [Apiospora arundinis]
MAAAHLKDEPKLEKNKAEVEAERGCSWNDRIKGPPSPSPTPSAAESAHTDRPVSPDPCSDRSPSPLNPDWEPWMDREPEIRRYTAVDWIGEYGQDSYEPDLGHFVVLFAFYDKKATQPRSSGTMDVEGGTGDEEAWEGEEPSRIIIRSFNVLNELKEVTGVAFPYQECLLKPPFKALTQYWPDIKQRLQQLKEEASRIDSLPESPTRGTTSEFAIPGPALGVARLPVDSFMRGPPPPPAAPTGDQQNPDPPLPRPQRGPILSEKEHLQRRIAHLEMLVRFGENALKRHLDLRAQIRDGTLQRIAFNDLWHLYNPGDLLLADERGYPQLYMVYNVTGGQPRLRNPTDFEIRTRGVRAGPRRRPIGRRGPRRGWYDAAESSGSYSGSSSDAFDTTMHDAMIGTITPFIIDCYALNVDSSGVGTLCSRKQIRKYLGLKTVSDLPLYPLKFHKDAQTILDQLQDRGRKFISCTGHRRYDGVTYDTRGIISRERLQGEIFVDADEYARSKSRLVRTKLCLLKRTNPIPAEVEESHLNKSGGTLYLHHDHAVDQRKSDVFIEKNPGIQELLTRDEALLMPEKLQLMQHSLQAFSFKSRSWVNIEIDNVETIDKSLAARESGFEDLSIPTKHRKLLISLVDNHAIRDDNSDDLARMNPKPPTQLDLVRGKGLGLIILLHGPPGSGKTSTAETIAAHTGRPLYAITCGDLGVSLEGIEMRLDVHTKRADKWGAVLLPG